MERVEKGLILCQSLSNRGILGAVSTKVFGNLSTSKGEGKATTKQLATFFQALGINPTENYILAPELGHSHNIGLVNPASLKKGYVAITPQNSECITTSDPEEKRFLDAAIVCWPQTFLVMALADCAPVMLFDPGNHHYALIHAGKKGVEQNIVWKTAKRMKTWCNCVMPRLICYIGPHICGQCYKPYGQAYDLQAQITKQLLDAGVLGTNIQASEFCTRENEELFFSHARAEEKGKEGRHLAIIGF